MVIEIFNVYTSIQKLFTDETHLKTNYFRMKKYVIIAIVLVFAQTSCSDKKELSSVLQYVDPFVGTTYTGHTFPGAAYPLGMMQPGPQTGNFEWKYCAGYKYEDPLIWGFTQNRLNGTGIPDMGDILMMPFSGTPRGDFRSAFSKESEKASPGYYAVALEDNSVDVELTTTPHVAIHRYRFKKENPAVYIDFQSGNTSSEDLYNTRVLYADIKVEDRQTIGGKMRVRHWVERDMFFVIHFNKPFVSADTLLGDPRNKAPKIVYHFDNEKELNIKVAISMVSVEGARKNMEAELSHWDFDKVRKDAEDTWEELLSRAIVEGSIEQKKNFYTSMYHLFIQPNNIADVDGQYRGANDSVALSPIGKYYSTFSLWDTFRAAHPLYTILSPEIVPDMVNSMLLHAETYGYLPIWALWGKESYVMIGNHGVPPVVEACLKDFPGVDQERAYQAVKKSLTERHRKYDWNMYDHYGYFPFDLVKEESASRTLECGYDDYCAALLAKKLGKEEDYEFFMKRSNYWKNLFDPESKLARAKDSKGQWRTPFDKYHLSHAGTAGGDYTEGNAWQYTWHVLQDVDGLIEAMGGNEAFTTKLDSLFVLDAQVEQEGFTGDVTGLIGQYAQGNEPSHHVVYLYSLAGKRERTAELVRDVFDRFYKPKPDGLCGNDDCGQMSAWYLFSAMGFYPVNPASGEYVLGAPQLPKVTLKLPEGKTFTVIANNLSEANKYVKSVKLNNVEITNPIITFAQIVEGGTLTFEMDSSSRRIID
ncbi:GH92 family glycosyl hydrolase [Olivibacter sitiensis]|uniref:GH92 family glycosyl hydrolase n=1 Tax=Olivibacter sitiensis TaxID=376470 RepID=UPI00041CB2CE|nr:GH92 family glycosyl hydrolase [Olivibacter sitiensis]